MPLKLPSLFGAGLGLGFLQFKRLLPLDLGWVDPFIGPRSIEPGAGQRSRAPQPGGALCAQVVLVCACLWLRVGMALLQAPISTPHLWTGSYIHSRIMFFYVVYLCCCGCRTPQPNSQVPGSRRCQLAKKHYKCTPTTSCKLVFVASAVSAHLSNSWK